MPAISSMSGSPTFDIDKKNGNGANLKLCHAIRVSRVITTYGKLRVSNGKRLVSNADKGVTCSKKIAVGQKISFASTANIFRSERTNSNLEIFQHFLKSRASPPMPWYKPKFAQTTKQAILCTVCDKKTWVKYLLKSLAGVNA